MRDPTRHQSHSYLSRYSSRYTHTIWSKSSNNTINAGFTSEERVKIMAGRVVSDLQSVGFAGERKLTLVFHLYTLVYTSVLSYTTYKSSHLGALVIYKILSPLSSSSNSRLRTLTYKLSSTIYGPTETTGPTNRMDLRNGAKAFDHFVSSCTTKSDDNQRHISTSSGRIDSRKISCHCYDHPADPRSIA